MDLRRVHAVFVFRVRHNVLNRGDPHLRPYPVAMGVRAIVPTLAIAALIASLFFIGTNIVVFGITLGLLITAMAIVLWSAHGETISVPRSALTVSLTLFWLWLAVTLLWTPVSFVSTTMFWWLSALPLGFWLYTLQPARMRAWSWLAGLSLLVGSGLVLTGVFQRLIGGETPQSAFLDVNIQAAVLMLMALPAGGYMLRAGTAREAGFANHRIAWVLFSVFGVRPDAHAQSWRDSGVLRRYGGAVRDDGTACSEKMARDLRRSGGARLPVGGSQLGWGIARQDGGHLSGYSSRQHRAVRDLAGILAFVIRTVPTVGHRAWSVLARLATVPCAGGRQRRLFCAQRLFANLD